MCGPSCANIFIYDFEIKCINVFLKGLPLVFLQVINDKYMWIRNENQLIKLFNEFKHRTVLPQN